MSSSYDLLPCGAYVTVNYTRHYIHCVDTTAHTTIIGTSSRTVLKQTFENTGPSNIDELRYLFPLYDGVSVVAFRCTVGDRVIEGVVEERAKAKATYEAAKKAGETAGLMEQSLSAADTFTTLIGNVPKGCKVFVDITYLGELEHDAEVDGIRFTIPIQIASRYGSGQDGSWTKASNVHGSNFSVTVDVEMPTGSAITRVQSPSHPIAVSIGHTSKDPEANQTFQRATATLSLGTSSLEADFVLNIVATNLGEPSALLETHPTINNHRALMTTLVPKFSLPAQTPEIVFICDRSGSMIDTITDLISALKIFLKSLPVGVEFNICSFGTNFSFLWPTSQTYSQATLDEATEHISRFTANMGGTEMYQPIEEAFKRRYHDLNLEVFVLTDGNIWDQDELFAMMSKHVDNSKGAIRVFGLGVGSDVSTSLVHGIARAGGGIAQFVNNNEKMDKKVVRMLRAALFPHVTDYRLDIDYPKCQRCGDDFELVEKPGAPKSEDLIDKPTISLFQKDLKEEDPHSPPTTSTKPLPDVQPPRNIQVPGIIPPLFPFSRTNVYMLLSNACPHVMPKSVFLRGTCSAGPLELEIPITVLDDKATTIHQLAARTEMKELEEGRGWVATAKVGNQTIKAKYPSQYDDIVEREGVRIGTTFHVSGKWCSFVAVEKRNDGDKNMTDLPPDYEEVVNVFQSSGQVLPLAASIPQTYSLPRTGAGQPPRGGGQLSMNTMSDGANTAHCSAPLRTMMVRPVSGGPQTLGRAGGTGGPRIMTKAASFLFGSAPSKSAQPPPARPPAPHASGAYMAHHGSAHPPARQRAAAPQLPAVGSGNFSTSSASGAYMDHRESALPPAYLQAARQLDATCLGNFSTSSASGAYMAHHGSAHPPARQQAAPQPHATGSGNFSTSSASGAYMDHRESALPPAYLQAARQLDVTCLGNFSTSLAWPEPPVDDLQELAGLQLFEGNWRWTLALEEVLGIKAGAAKAAAPGHADDVVATACAVAYFKTKLMKNKEAWELIVEKAEGWLAAQGEDVAALEKAVQALF